MHFYPVSYSYCRSGSDAGLGAGQRRYSTREPEPTDSGESTLSDLDEQVPTIMPCNSETPAIVHRLSDTDPRPSPLRKAATVLPVLLTESRRRDTETESGSGVEVDPNLPYPGIAPLALGYLSQTTRPRSWCLALISNPYPF